jgi:ATP-dependent DNA ligase
MAEPKLDGGRYMLYLEHDGTVHFYSRRDFPRIDKCDVVPHIARPYPQFRGTILDGEVVLPDQTQLSETTRILNMTPKKAVAEQEKRGKLTYHVFDILFVRGDDVRWQPYHIRRTLLESVISGIANPHIQIIPQSKDYAQLFTSIIAQGGEGIVLKHIRSSYGMNWIKMKRRHDVSCVVSGFQEGQGKYRNNLGSLRVSVWNDGKLVEVATCSGMTDAERSQIWRHKERFIGRVVDVFAQSITQDKRLRHPIFHRFRDDYSPRDCTMKKLLSDLQAGT